MPLVTDYAEVQLRLWLRVAIGAGIKRVKSKKQRRALKLVYDSLIDSGGFNLTEIAARCGLPQSSFHELVGRSLEALRDELEEDPIIVEYLSTGGVS